MAQIQYIYNDGGRNEYFAAKEVNDCVVRSIAIVTGRDYKDVYDEVWSILGYTPRNGIRHNDVKRVMKHFGGIWTPCMTIGSGCKVHLASEELPKGKIICNLSGHVAAVLDGVLNDTYDCSRKGKRCVYGYWRF